MSEIVKESSGYVGYEYKDLTVSRGMEAVYADSYPSFGWDLDGTSHSDKGVGHVILKFKRDRKIRNKAELTRLQRQFEGCAKEIEKLERAKSIGASTAAYIIGVVGTAFMAGSVFAYIGGALPLSIVLAVPGFVGWVLPYLVFTRLRSKKTEAVTPLIETQYDAVYDVCQKASGLLAQ